MIINSRGRADALTSHGDHARRPAWHSLWFYLAPATVRWRPLGSRGTRRHRAVLLLPVFRLHGRAIAHRPPRLVLLRLPFLLRRRRNVVRRRRLKRMFAEFMNTNRLKFWDLQSVSLLKWKQRQNAHSNGPWDLMEHKHRFWVKISQKLGTYKSNFDRKKIKFLEGRYLLHRTDVTWVALQSFSLAAVVGSWRPGSLSAPFILNKSRYSYKQ